MTKEFIIDDKTKIVCRTGNTRNGFKHVCEWRTNDKVVEKRSTSYLNRTWESYRYETAIKLLLEKMKVSDAEAKKVLSITSGKSHADTDAKFKTTANVMALGAVFTKTKKEKNAWRVKMLKASFGGQGLSIPANWDSLSEDEKEKRLDKLEAFMGKR